MLPPACMLITDLVLLKANLQFLKYRSLSQLCVAVLPNGLQAPLMIASASTRRVCNEA